MEKEKQNFSKNFIHNKEENVKKWWQNYYEQEKKFKLSNKKFLQKKII